MFADRKNVVAQVGHNSSPLLQNGQVHDAEINYSAVNPQQANSIEFISGSAEFRCNAMDKGAQVSEKNIKGD